MAGSIPNFLKLWEIGDTDPDNERKLVKLLLAGLDVVVHQPSDTLSMMKVLPQVANPLVRWMEEIRYPFQLPCNFVNATGTFTIPADTWICGKKVTADAAGGLLIQSVVRVGTIFEQPSTGRQVKVTSITGLATGNTFVGAAYGGTTLAADQTGETWTIISEPWSDYTEVTTGRAIDRDFRQVGTQILAESFEIPQTRKSTRMELVNDEVEHQIASLLHKMRQSLGLSALRSRPSNGIADPSYGTKVQDPTMCGLTVWPEIVYNEIGNAETYKDLSSAELTYKDVNTLVKRMWIDNAADFGKGNWIAIVHPDLHEKIQAWDQSFRRMTQKEKTIGYEVDTLRLNSVGADLKLVPDLYQRPSLFTVADISQCGYGYYNNDKLNRKEIATKGRFQQWLLSFQAYGTVVRNPIPSLGQIYGISTS